MVRAQRRKRASEDTLYRGCLAGQDCPPDIKAKYEQDTLADRILKWVSTFLYFGHLGISSGKGTGGQGGYTRLGGSGVSGGKGTNVTRPTVLVDALPPPGVPIDTVSPDSSIIPLLTDSGGATTTDLIPGTGEIEIVAEVHPPPTNGQDSVIIGLEPEPPVLEVTPEHTPIAPRTRTTVSKHDNPAFNAYVASTQLPAETAASDNVHIFHGFGGEIIGATEGATFEEIPLEEFNPPTQGPSSSTPESGFRGVLDRFQRRLYNRRLVQQVKVTRRSFLDRPSSLVRWEFDNPTYEDDVSLLFEQDVHNVSAAPDLDFQDVVKLSRPHIYEKEGYIRLSRLGKKATISTRSGTTIGSQVHYYSDLSPIQPVEEIPLHTFSSTDRSVIMQPLEESVIIGSEYFDENAVIYNEDTSLLPEFADDVLDDPYEEDFANTRLEVSGSSSRQTIYVPDGIPPGSVRAFVTDYNNHSTVTPEGSNPLQPDIIHPDIVPDIILDIYTPGSTFYLHPSHYRRRGRKRKRTVF
ncbi:L2 capsid protein [Bos taurus papillomavirus 20]|uniref:Minor capsid protein L2 n=1 Tax=Bos taurus papillomavirus 20 TaxID=1887218 RepID=A0A1B2K225_9PAPI|nr:L2 capsid protein [Bos taurus papillomavirus 20]ANZ90261.1 L2 capsid protein [Bos taurus papillomavirus 20]